MHPHSSQHTGISLLHACVECKCKRLSQSWGRHASRTPHLRKLQQGIQRKQPQLLICFKVKYVSLPVIRNAAFKHSSTPLDAASRSTFSTFLCSWRRRYSETSRPGNELNANNANNNVNQHEIPEVHGALGKRRNSTQTAVMHLHGRRTRQNNPSADRRRSHQR